MLRSLHLAHLIYYLFVSLIALQAPPDPVPSAHKVPGLELPAPVEVPAQEKFVILDAKAEGQVKFLVVSTGYVKFVQSGNAILVSTPNPGEIVNVYAVALVEKDGVKSLTEFARTQITTAGKPPSPPTPSPLPVPDVKPITGKLAVAIIEDPTQRTPEMAAVINSTAIRGLLAQHTFRVFDVKDQTLNANGLNTALQRLNARPPLLLVADQGGVIRHHQQLPATEAEILAILKKLLGQ